MTNRRFTHTFATPRLTGGDERPTPACAGNPEPFDVLHDFNSGPTYEYAKRAALNLCNGCPLKAGCWEDPANEVWVRSLLGKRKPGPEPSARCGTAGGARRHARAGEPTCDECKAAGRERVAKQRADQATWQRNLEANRARVAAEAERRMTTLRELVDMGADLHDALRALDIKRDALNKWCQRHDAKHLYHQLNGTKGAAA